MIEWLLLTAFVAAQGAAVVGTAWLFLKWRGVSHWFAKIGLTAFSYIVWIAITIGGYTLLGGEGGLMDGFGLILFLCVTALFSSFAFLLLWFLAPLLRRATSR